MRSNVFKRLELITFTTSSRKTQLQAKPRRSRCCCAFRVSISISSARCPKKWSPSGDLPDTRPIVPRGVRSLNRLSSKESEEDDLDKLPLRDQYEGASRLRPFSVEPISRKHFIPYPPSSEQSPHRHRAGRYVETQLQPPSCGRRRSQLPQQRVPVALRPPTHRAHSRRFLPS